MKLNNITEKEKNLRASREMYITDKGKQIRLYNSTETVDAP